MKAAKISQTVPLEKPDSAQATDGPGLGSTRPSTVATPTPTNPTAAAGRGSMIVPAITPQNTAKKAHALNLRPAGTGINTIMIAMITGARAIHRLIAGFFATGGVGSEEHTSE